MKYVLKRTLFVLLAMATVAAPGPRDVGGAEPSPSHESPHNQQQAATQGVPDLSWWSVDGGGGASAGGSFSILAAVGQPDVGLTHAGNRVLDGGVWSTSVDLSAVFSDGFESGGTGNWSTAVLKNETTDGGEAPGGER